jgi:hypothetical protein
MTLLDEACSLIALLLEEVDQAWPYAGDYFEDKWRSRDLEERARSFLARADEAGNVEARTVEAIAAWLEKWGERGVADARQRRIDGWASLEEVMNAENFERAMLCAAEEIRFGAWRPK